MRGNIVRYKLGCSLSYEIGSAATFIFNLEVARIASHKILDESLALTPPLERGVYTDPATKNRAHRVWVIASGPQTRERNLRLDL
jgi:Bacterial transglutaminase, N-terminal domain